MVELVITVPLFPDYNRKESKRERKEIVESKERECGS
jgi:hypothetical protein